VRHCEPGIAGFFQTHICLERKPPDAVLSITGSMQKQNQHRIWEPFAPIWFCSPEMEMRLAYWMARLDSRLSWRRGPLPFTSAACCGAILFSEQMKMIGDLSFLGIRELSAQFINGTGSTTFRALNPKVKSD
jgi:hypothetical protein